MHFYNSVKVSFSKNEASDKDQTILFNHLISGMTKRINYIDCLRKHKSINDCLKRLDIFLCRIISTEPIYFYAS